MYGIWGKSFKTLFLEEIGSKLNGSQPLCIAAVHLKFTLTLCLVGNFIKKYILLLRGNIISYPLFADADTGIYPHTASQYLARRPKAKHGIAMLSVDKFLYTRKHTRGNKFIPWSNDLCHILKLFHNFKIPAIPFIWLRSSNKQCYSVASQQQGKWTVVVITIVTSSMTFLSLYISCWWRQTWDTDLYLTVFSQSKVRVSTEHGNGTFTYTVSNVPL